MASSVEPLPLSAAIVCRNNFATIGRTLDSLHNLCSEVLAIDSGSTDGTIELLESRGARVIRSDWLGHVRTKQMALEASTQPWVFCIDSDESIEPELAEAIRASLGTAPDAGPDGYLINRRTYYNNRPLLHAWQPEHRLRLVRREAARWGGLDPHDKLELIDPRATPGLLTPGAMVGARRLTSACVLRHDSFPTFVDHFRTQVSHGSTMARSLHAAGKRGSLARLLISPPGAFVKQLILKRGFLDGTPGWLAASSTALGALVKHAALLELSLRDKRSSRA
jgi:glycosyltransferase involved in cell wall biosynthesis